MDSSRHGEMVCLDELQVGGREKEFVEARIRTGTIPHPLAQVTISEVTSLIRVPDPW